MIKLTQLSGNEYKSTIKGFILTELFPLTIIFLIVPLGIASLIIWVYLKKVPFWFSIHLQKLHLHKNSRTPLVPSLFMWETIGFNVYKNNSDEVAEYFKLPCLQNGDR